MSLRFLVIIATLLIILGFMPYLFHEAAMPGNYTANTNETALSWSVGPDVELNAASLDKLNTGVQQLARPYLGGQMNPFCVVSLGKRKVGVMTIGTTSPPPGLQERVNDYVQKRLSEVAREQGG